MKTSPRHFPHKGFFRFDAAGSGFTLIELIATIAIICALAALLFPVVGKMRESANATKCSANLRSIAAQATIWSSDNGGWVPPARWLIDSGVNKGAVDRKLRQCPALPPLPVPASDQADNATSYGINIRLVTGDPMWGPNYQYYNDRGRYKTAVLSMSSTILFADTLSPGTKVGYYVAMNQWFDARHGKSANVVFVDGHMETRNATELALLETWTRGIPDQEKKN